MEGKNKKSLADDELYVLGVGTSAGGMDALTKLLSSFNGTSLNLCVIIVQHLSPNYKSELASILARQCKWPVEPATDNTVVEAYKIYVTPQNKSIVFKNKTIELGELASNYTHAPSIDDFLTSLAQDKKDHAIGMILSGTGQDGARGIEAIKDQGGFTLAQSPDSAQYGDMPMAAIQTHKIDMILPPSRVFEEVSYYIRNHRLIRETKPRQKSIDMIFDLLSKRCGIDFSQYKQSTILRRLDKRIEALHLGNLTDYYQAIKKNPQELDTLFKTVLIGVTEFFRDEHAFETLKDQLSKYLEENKSQSAIRIWSVGCATGEEPYSIGILLHEILGPRLFEYQIQIFASDIDDRALNIARKGVYSIKSLEKLSQQQIEKYFEKVEGGYEVKKVIKQHILFSRHDITNDPPYVKLDLIVCRNLLIYFNNYLQKECLKVFNYALKQDGLLFLGKSESVSVSGDHFIKVDGVKIFRKVPSTSSLNLRFSRFKVRDSHNDVEPTDTKIKNMSLVDIAKETLYYANSNPFVIITENGDIKESQGSLRLYTELNSGATNTNILKMANKELVLEIRSLLVHLKKASKPYSSNVIPFRLFDRDHCVRLIATPLIYPTGGLHYYLLEFESLPPEQTLLKLNKEISFDEFESIRVRELEQDNISMREHLQTFTEELESSNEEMQAVNEELQSANEELKSANEELETSNEELQSANEELHTANNELRLANNLLIDKEAELKLAKQECENNEILYRTIAENIPNGTIGILDDQLRIEYIAGKGLELYNINVSEVIGKVLPALNPSPTEQRKISDSFTRALHGEQNQIEFEFDKRKYTLESIPFRYPLSTENKVMYLTQDITVRKGAEDELKHQQLQFRMLANNIPILCWMAHADGHIYWYNHRWYEFTGTTVEQMEGWGWQAVHHPEVLPEVLKQWEKSLSQEEPFEMVFPLKRADGVYRKFLTRILPVKDESLNVVRWFGTNTDITDRESIAEQKDEFMSIASHELKTPVTSIKGFIQVSEIMLAAGKIAEVQGILSKAHNQVNRLTSLINDLLDVSKLKAGGLDFSYSMFSLQDIIDESIEELTSYPIDQKITVTGDVETVIWADKMRLEQVVTNFLSNAIKYSPGAQAIDINVNKTDNDITVTFKDYGIGIPLAKQENLFQRFYRVDPNSYQFQGLGMGLFISAEIIKRHKGHVGVKSEEGKGSAFFFTLPLPQNM